MTSRDKTLAAAGRLGFDPDTDQFEPFLTHLAPDQAQSRFERLAEFKKELNTYNADGLILTPFIAGYLSEGPDFEERLREIIRLRTETREGRFDSDNPLQRDLEFPKFRWKNTKLGLGPRSIEELYLEFTRLQWLPPPQEREAILSGEHIAELERAAFEAKGLLDFLREFRAATSRPIVVVGNDRYGRQWAVEPLEELLQGDFTLRYDRVPSHASMRLTVSTTADTPKSVFPRDFVRHLGSEMPHVVVVDGCNMPRKEYMMRFSRAQRSYANWFLVFNDLRANGHPSAYQDRMLFDREHLAALRKWHDFVAVRDQMREGVAPGPTYTLTVWAPEPTKKTLLGDVEVLSPPLDLSTSTPMAVFANPIVYRTDLEFEGRATRPVHDGLPDYLRNTAPYYFDGPEKFVKETLALGFGPHGFETRVEGPTTESFVAELQRRIKNGVNQLVAEQQ